MTGSVTGSYVTGSYVALLRIVYWCVIFAAGTWRYSYDVFGNTEVNHYQPSDALRWNNDRANLTVFATHHPNGTVANELSVFETGDRRTQFMASYGYDAQGRALGASIFGADGMAPVVRDVHYNVDGALDGISWPHDVRLDIAYHPQLRGRAASLVTRDRLGELFSITHNAFDNADRLTSETQRLRDHLTTSKFYSYDTMGRLNSNFRSAARSSALEQYAFDDAGNITAAKGLFGVQAYRYDDKEHPHAVTSVNTRTLSYDADGVLKQDGNSQFVFDGFGCLREVRNADGNRMLGLCGPDGNQMYRESRLGETGPPRDRRFEFGERLRLRPDENVSEFRMVLGALPVFVQQRSLLTGARIADGTRYLHPDLRGSVVATTVAGFGRATIAQTAMFDAWGSRRPWNTYDKLPRHGFIGMEPDPLHGRYAMGKRLYDPSLRRFVQPDPLFLHAPEKALHDGVELNLWGYAANDPVNNIDPTGTVIETPWDAANVAAGVTSALANVASGNYIGAAVDAVGVAVDVALAAVPGVPGGAATAINSARAANAIPNNGIFARVMPMKYAEAFAAGKGTLSAGSEAFVTAADDLSHVTTRTEAQKTLSLFSDAAGKTPNVSGDALLTFKTRDATSLGLRSPIETISGRGFGFIPGGKTAGGAREWLINSGTSKDLNAFEIQIRKLE